MANATWSRRMKLKLKLSSPVGVTLSNSEAKMLLDEQKKGISVLKEDETKLDKIKRSVHLNIDDSISEASQALNQARGTYMLCFTRKVLSNVWHSPQLSVASPQLSVATYRGKKCQYKVT